MIGIVNANQFSFTFYNVTNFEAIQCSDAFYHIMKHRAPRQYLSALRTEQIEMFVITGRKVKRMLAERENLKQSVRFFVKLWVTLLKVTFMGERFF